MPQHVITHRQLLPWKHKNILVLVTLKFMIITELYRSVQIYCAINKREDSAACYIVKHVYLLFLHARGVSIIYSFGRFINVFTSVSWSKYIENMVVKS